jgi:recombination protein RecA
MAARKDKTLNEDRKESLAQLYGLLEKVAGPGAGRPIPEQAIEPIERITSSLLSVNFAMGGGLPRGRIVEFYGTESGGKTSLSIDFMAQTQKLGGVAAYIDAEHSFDPDWAAKLGLDVSKMLYHSPSTGEEALEVTGLMAKSGAVDLIVIDSVSALVPKAELEGDMGQAHVGLQARLMSQALRKLVGIADKHKCAILFINQLREKIGVMFGSPETTSGGRALKFYAAMRVDVRKGDKIEAKGEQIGNQVRIHIVKNKTAPPFKKALIPLMYASGFDMLGELVDNAIVVGAITKAGAWYYWGSAKLGQGREAALGYFHNHSTDVATLRKEVVEHFQKGALNASPTPTD